jgi:hypothetical protein
VRRILEAALAREFVAKATPADYKRIEKHLTAERKSLGGNDAQTRTRLLGDFHIVLAEVAGNNVLTEIMRELSMRSAVITMLYQSRRDATCSSDEHRAFIDAARAGDADLAVKLMVEHLAWKRSALRGSTGGSARQGPGGRVAGLTFGANALDRIKDEEGVRAQYSPRHGVAGAHFMSSPRPSQEGLPADRNGCGLFLWGSSFADLVPR